MSAPTPYQHRAAVRAALLTFLDSHPDLVVVTAIPASHPGAGAVFHIPALGVPGSMERPDLDGEILRLLEEKGHRMTTPQIVTALVNERNCPYAEGTIKTTLAAMVRTGQLTSNLKANPKGYGLPEWNDGPEKKKP